MANMDNDQRASYSEYRFNANIVLIFTSSSYVAMSYKKSPVRSQPPQCDEQFLVVVDILAVRLEQRSTPLLAVPYSQEPLSSQCKSSSIIGAFNKSDFGIKSASIPTRGS
ncbi:conserved hypothetical protein [Trichinella spiralis]|uniref:hypothetical protein n=1 Tax=Trichinella spiralis TaxID=6334 RepID=UPI0001EFC5B0|nr:conserved hypothetical protein [Trichinella spiralis]